MWKWREGYARIQCNYIVECDKLVQSRLKTISFNAIYIQLYLSYEGHGSDSWVSYPMFQLHIAFARHKYLCITSELTYFFLKLYYA